MGAHRAQCRRAGHAGAAARPAPGLVRGHCADAPKTAWLFPGQGSQYAGMARELFETEPVFATWMDRGLDVLQPKLDYDIRALWLPSDADPRASDPRRRSPWNWSARG